MANLDELLRTQALLQKSHDYIEVFGFNIDFYEGSDGACCHIGTVRKMAGLPADPDGHSPSSGDGPELVRAFKILDGVIKRRLSSNRVEKVKDTVSIWRGEEVQMAIGRYVESYGFQFRDDGDDFVGNDAETQEALRIFRKALTKVYKQIEKAQNG